MSGGGGSEFGAEDAAVFDDSKFLFVGKIVCGRDPTEARSAPYAHVPIFIPSGCSAVQGIPISSILVSISHQLSKMGSEIQSPPAILAEEKEYVLKTGRRGRPAAPKGGAGVDLQSAKVFIAALTTDLESQAVGGEIFFETWEREIGMESDELCEPIKSLQMLWWAFAHKEKHPAFWNACLEAKHLARDGVLGRWAFKCVIMVALLTKFKPVRRLVGIQKAFEIAIVLGPSIYENLCNHVEKVCRETVVEAGHHWQSELLPASIADAQALKQALESVKWTNYAKRLSQNCFHCKTQSVPLEDAVLTTFDKLCG